LPQIDDDLLKLPQFGGVLSVELVALGIVAFGQYGAQLDDSLVLLILRLLSFLQVFVVYFFRDVNGQIWCVAGYC